MCIRRFTKKSKNFKKREGRGRLFTFKRLHIAEEEAAGGDLLTRDPHHSPPFHHFSKKPFFCVYIK